MKRIERLITFVILAVVCIVGGVKQAMAVSVVDEKTGTQQTEQPYLERIDGDNGRFGFKNALTGVEVSPCKWLDASFFSREGFAAVKDVNGKWGYIDLRGRLVIPCKWKLACDFSEGLACVRDDNNKCGFIDKTGKLVIPCRFETTYTGFENGEAMVRLGNWPCYIDREGNVIKK